MGVSSIQIVEFVSFPTSQTRDPPTVFHVDIHDKDGFGMHNTIKLAFSIRREGELLGAR